MLAWSCPSGSGPIVGTPWLREMRAEKKTLTAHIFLQGSFFSLAGKTGSLCMQDGGSPTSSLAAQVPDIVGHSVFPDRRRKDDDLTAACVLVCMFDDRFSSGSLECGCHARGPAAPATVQARDGGGREVRKKQQKRMRAFS